MEQLEPLVFNVSTLVERSVNKNKQLPIQVPMMWWWHKLVCKRSRIVEGFLLIKDWFVT